MKMMMVIDASMALAWIFERVKPEEAACADRALDEVTRMEMIVPFLWHTEIANALLVGERRKVVSEAQVIDYLARQQGLSAYDATYLELALRKGAMLATFDGKLAKVMRNVGGMVFE
jgi:predicted nucleic acid-binding protein